MGGSSSKHNAPPETVAETAAEVAETAEGVRRSRSLRRRVMESSCLGSHGYDDDDDDEEEEVKEKATTKCCRKANHEHPDVGSDELGRQSSFFRRTERRDNSTSSRVLSSRSFNSSANSFASRCRLFRSNTSSRLQRSNSMGSARALCTPSTTCNVSNDEDDVHRCSNASSSPNAHGRPQTCDFLGACFPNQSSRRRREGFSSNNQDFSVPSPSLSGNWLDDQIVDSAEDTGIPTHTYSSFRSIAVGDNFEARHPNRRIAVQEPIDRYAQFSRTLSVGRLRDRVLQRSSFVESASCPFQQDRVERNASQTSRRTDSMGRSEAEADITASPISSNHSPSFLPRSPFRRQNYESGTEEARRLDILEHRSNFLERRRRIRSQAHALQHLGSRFQHLSGHERSCILSGQHRTGHCRCRVTYRNNNSNNETAARASISRIVMLAEALFEVLDEIHQQTVVLSSRPTISSIGSIPAPIEVVNSLPVKYYSKAHKHQEDNTQCYICLIEYEEGDMVRILPCHHEFHRTCIDKWLKEIHRVCPLCRGDICGPCSASTH